MRNKHRLCLLLCAAFMILIVSVSGKAAENGEGYEFYNGDVLTFEQTVQGIKEGESCSFLIQVPESARYTLSFDARTTGNNILPSSAKLLVNGEPISEQMRSIKLTDVWRSGEKQYDRYGNECLAMPVRELKWCRTYLYDTAYLSGSPGTVYLEKGENEITFTMKEGSAEFGNLYLEGSTVLPGDALDDQGGTELIVMEAEDMSERDLANIRTDSEFNTEVTPCDPTVRKQNIVAEDSFRSAGSTITYEFDVKTAGYYYVTVDYRQSEKSGFPVYRNILIDGSIPSKGFENVKYDYARKFTRQKGEIPVWLDAGRHSVSIQASIAPVSDAIRALTELNDELNSLSLAASKISGGNVEKFRDFDLSEFDLDVEGKLRDWIDRIDQVYEDLALLNPEVSDLGEITLLKVATATLKKLAKKPDDFCKYLDEFSLGESSARNQIVLVMEQLYQSPMGLDKVMVHQRDAKLPGKISFWKALKLQAVHFFRSFRSQEYTPSYDESGDALQVWVSRPRQYLEIMQRMADSDFTEKTGIKVDLSIVPDQNKLILANASGKTPDAAIGINSNLVYDLAVRGSLYNMREFDNFAEVAGRVPPGLLIPGACDEGMYAIPETFNFWVLLYRTDILESLGLKVPDSMDDVRQMLPELKRRGLEFNNHVANLAARPYAATMPYILQSGGTLFEPGSSYCQIDSEEVLSGLTYLTENFTIYDMEYEVLSFYQNFRSGKMPLGISDYGTFKLLINAAPEIADDWAIAPYPGITDEFGNVLRYTSGAAESSVIFSSAERAGDAWAFIDWWMSDEIQSEFAYTLQSTLGNEYLWNSANMEAIMDSPWSYDHKQVIQEQLKWTVEAPRVPGGYMIERELGNAVNYIVLDGMNVREAADDANKRINREIEKKLEEFNYTKDGVPIRPFVVPTIEMMEEWLRE